MAIEKTMLNSTPKTFKLRNLKLPNRKQRKFLIAGGLVVLVLIAVAVSNATPLSAKVLTLHPQDFTKGFTEQGQIIPSEEWPIFNQVDGKLQSLKVKDGDSVKKGQVLFEMSTSDLNYQLEGLKAQIQSLEGQRLQNYKTPNSAQIAQQKLMIEQAEKDAQTAELNLTRMKALVDVGSISKLQLEEAQASLDKATNYLAQQKEGLNLIYEQNQVSPGTEQYYDNQEKVVQAQISQLEDKKSKAAGVAPQDGIVKDLTLKEGNVIPIGQQVMTVYGNKGYKLESFVLASDALDIKMGSPVQIVQATSAGNKQFSGKVEAVDSSAVERVSSLGLKENRVKVTIVFVGNSSSPAVILGSNVDVKFTTLEVPSKLLIPKTALFPYQQGEAVWLVQQGIAKIKPVKKGLENDSDVIIEQGLSEGDVILLDTNLTNLKEGKRVKASL
ncbi:efflux RND transporter periplasmic adaptor subunit [Desulfosporosinus metallidurans]|uniref:Putative Co/Zn/Cd efflux system membrane fusion protein n=1 Tax=Desulfosporosinus metallidurans TaxID=1888891 RepID=A0A1Q8QR04_9FIRM|nr:HlyD family efflux transporter periplasmic adaptor subunit [Desulfosporosinus metallidurans]OLN29732.1 putative Co/Zn/Cd efflux system membrane fusion protein [Desulfosporosinus metallidurans]